jgi:hypothetical protein
LSPAAALDQFDARDLWYGAFGIPINRIRAPLQR